MKDFFKKYKTLWLILIPLSGIIVYLFYQALSPQRQLPIYNPAMVNHDLVDESLLDVKKYHTISDFSLTNQNGVIVTQKDYEGKIYVASFFFTSCQAICPIMTDNMGYLQAETLADDAIMFISHSVTPSIDTVAQLKKYALQKGVIDKKWNLVTGNKKHIYELARKSYLAVRDNGSDDLYDMIHTENFILIDKKRRIRGFYDGTDKKDMSRLLEDITILKEEPSLSVH